MPESLLVVKRKEKFKLCQVGFYAIEISNVRSIARARQKNKSQVIAIVMDESQWRAARIFYRFLFKVEPGNLHYWNFPLITVISASFEINMKVSAWKVWRGV